MRFTEEHPEIGPKPHYVLIAVLPHSAGIHNTGQAIIEGTTRQELLDAAWTHCIGSRLVGRLVTPVDQEVVWTEGAGWTEDRSQD